MRVALQQSTSIQTESIPLPTKLVFWFTWTLAHVLSGGLGMFLGDMAMRSKLFGDFSLIAGLILFEGILALTKHGMFRLFKRMNYLQGIDQVTWVLSGIAIVVGRLIDGGDDGEGITLLSLSLIRLYSLLITSYILTSQIPHFFNPEANQKRKIWFSQAREYVEERPILKPISLLFLILAVILLYGITLVVVGIYLVIAFAPVEELKILFLDMPAGPMRVFLFGCTFMGWTGFWSGLCYLLSYRKGLELVASAFDPKGRRI